MRSIRATAAYGSGGGLQESRISRGGERAWWPIDPQHTIRVVVVVVGGLRTVIVVELRPHARINRTLTLLDADALAPSP